MSRTSPSHPGLPISAGGQSKPSLPVIYVPRTPRHALQWALSVPGAAADRFARAPRLPSSPLSADDAAALCARSHRANSYLCLEPGARIVGDAAGFAGAFSWRRTAFITGGWHGDEPAQQSIRGVKNLVLSAGFRRILAFPVSRADVAAYREEGYACRHVGSEPMVDLQQYSFAGRAKGDIRTMARRSERGGASFVERDPADAAIVWADVWRRWIRTRGGRPMRVVVGSPCFDQPQGRRYVGAIDRRTGAGLAFVTLTPGWADAQGVPRGWGIDVMARVPEAPPGTMELIWTTVIRTLAAEGADWLSLGSCPMSERAAPLAADPEGLRPLFRYLYGSGLGNRLFRFRHLERFKAKFVPRWEPVYMAGWPSLGPWSLYQGCRMWGLFGEQLVAHVPGP